MNFQRISVWSPAEKEQWDLILLENEGRSCEVEKPCLSPFQGEYYSPTFRDSSQSHYLRWKVNFNPSVLSRTPQTAASQLTSQLQTAKGKEVQAINKINPEGSNRSVPDRERKLWKHYLEYKSNDKRSAGKCVKHVESKVKCVKLSAAFMCEWCESVTVRPCDAEDVFL